MKHGSLTIPV